MSIEKEFFKKVKTKTTKSGFTREKYVIRKCDFCGKIEEANFYVVERGRKLHPGIDYCFLCSRKNRKPSIKGKDHGNFKHGLSSHGYKRITINGQRIYEHRLIAEQILGRKLSKEESIHHIDLNKINNDKNNLFICENEKEHQKIHQSANSLALNLLNTTVYFDKINKIYCLKFIPSFIKKPIDIKWSDINATTNIYITNHNNLPYYQVMILKNNGKRSTKLIHVLMIEQKIGRYLLKNEVIHHINGNTIDNNESNLILMTRSEHSIAHRSLEYCTINLIKQGIVEFKNKQYILKK